MSLPKLKSNIDLDILKNPFVKDKVDGIYMRLTKKLFDGDVFNNWIGSIEFKNGNTEGNQKFECSTIEELLYQMKIFLDNLK